MAESASQRQLLEGLARALDLESVPERIEVYDNSHISGEKAVGGMIVAGPEGMIKNAYRKFNIRIAVNRRSQDGPMAGDDYAMMREVLSRRFSRALKEDPDRSGGQWPDLVLIDGGAGQLSVVREVFTELGIEDVALASIAKGPDRNAGRERFFLPDREPFSLDERDPVLYFLQRLRDEAHRFAIGVHRGRRQKVLVRSILDEIPGIGAKRKKALLHHFGSAREVSQAGATDLQAADGINAIYAKKIYDWFHTDA
jgi:excinuclease ABC subunit C